MKTAISLPDDLFEAAERFARRLGIPRSALYQRALAEFLERHRDRGVTEALDAVYAGAAPTAGLDSVLAALQGLHLLEDPW